MRKTSKMEEGKPSPPFDQEAWEEKLRQTNWPMILGPSRSKWGAKMSGNFWYARGFEVEVDEETQTVKLTSYRWPEKPEEKKD